jgi:hypothetical protein
MCYIFYMATTSQPPLRASDTEQAKAVLTLFFRSRKTPFHYRQIQVLFETEFYHITTTQAIYSLIDDGMLTTQSFTAGANKVTFVFPSHLATHPYKNTLLSHIRAKAKIISLYDNPDVSRILGNHFESLVKNELRANGLRIVSTNTNQYKTRQWPDSRANLDIIAEHQDGRAFGIQAKNELKPIERNELLLQLSICDYLGLKPVFIVRYMPWSFLTDITAQKGFLLTLGTQIYPLGFNKLCQQIRDKLSISESHVSQKLRQLAPKMRTTWPIEVLTEIPADASERLSFWLRTGRLPTRSAS